MTRLVRVGFVGCGSHAVQNLYPSFRLSVANPPDTGGAIGELAEGGEVGELVACCDVDEARARRCARDFGIPGVYTDHRELLERADVDCVVVAMHPRLQPAVAIDCLEAGKHVLIEKPPAETLEDCLAMKEAGERAGRHVMVAFMKRFSHPYLRARAIASRPEFGPLTAYEARFTFGVYPPRSVYDFLNGFGCHHLDLARWLMGDVAWAFAARASLADGDTPEWRPGRLELPVTGSAWRDMWQAAEGREPPQEEAWACVVGFESGAVGTIQLASLERLNERVVLTGRQAAVHVEGWWTVTSYLPGRDAPEVWEPAHQLPGDALDPRQLHGYAGELRHFVERARDGVAPDVTIDDGIAALRLERALKRSLAERRPVEP
ncbi:MAG: Gfo/Idh/MocA family oxidoreductase [Thermoleophilia bacterium]|nr:Gfo/Idh/MocA family oxidoreductase [Thermoleophilia bacterium]